MMYRFVARMKNPLKVCLLACATCLLGSTPSWANDTNCAGREYRATVLHVNARSARLEVDLGFDMIYRGLVELDGTLEPSNPALDWYGKASEALRAKIGGKVVTLCVINGNGKMAYFFVDGESVNDWMVKNGFLKYRPFPPFGITTKF